LLAVYDFLKVSASPEAVIWVLFSAAHLAAYRGAMEKLRG
jgi:hypothetical protein